MVRSSSWIAFGLVSAACAFEAHAQFVTDRIYVADYQNHRVFEVDPANWTVSEFKPQGSGPIYCTTVAWTPQDTLYVSDPFNSKVWEYDSSGSGKVLWDSAKQGIHAPHGANGYAWAANGDLYFANTGAQQVLHFPAAGGGPFVFADGTDGLRSPCSLAFDASGRLFVSERDSGKLFVFDTAGNATQFDQILGSNGNDSIVRRGDCDLYVADKKGRIHRYPGGDATLRVELVDLSALGIGRAALQWDRFHDRLYYVSNAHDGFLVVDPETGTWQDVAPGAFGVNLPVDLNSITVVGERCGPNFRPYLTGKAGTGGVVPTLNGTGSATLGGNLTLEVRDFVGGTFGLLVFDLNPDSTRMFGGDFGVFVGAATGIVPLTLPGVSGLAGAGDLDFDDTIPNDPAFECVHFYAQVVAVDPGASRGLSLSNALDLFIGH